MSKYAYASWFGQVKENRHALYEKRKNEVRNEAIEWQNLYFGEDSPSISICELIAWHNHFEKLAKRYGLTNEFRENGII